MGNKNLENLDFIKEMKGKRRIDGLPFYDILENPDYRLRFEYADPVGIDKDGKVFFYEGKDQDSNLMESFNDDNDQKKELKNQLMNIKAHLNVQVQKKKRSMNRDSMVATSIHEERQNQLPLEILNLMFLK